MVAINKIFSIFSYYNMQFSSCESIKSCVVTMKRVVQDFRKYFCLSCRAFEKSLDPVSDVSVQNWYIAYFIVHGQFPYPILLNLNLWVRCLSHFAFKKLLSNACIMCCLLLLQACFLSTQLFFTPSFVFTCWYCRSEMRRELQKRKALMYLVWVMIVAFLQQVQVCNMLSCLDYFFHIHYLVKTTCALSCLCLCLLNTE